MKRPLWARAVSAVFHPFLMPLFTLVTLFAVDEVLHQQPAMFLYFAFILLVNTLGAAVSLYLMYRRGVIGDLDIRDRRERWLPFTVVLVYYLMTLFVLESGDAVHTPPLYVGMLRGVVAAIATAIVITQRFKLSMHLLGVGGLVGAVFAAGQIHFTPHLSALALWIFIAGLVGASRLALRVHREEEVYAGFLWGAVVVYLAVMWTV